MDHREAMRGQAPPCSHRRRSPSNPSAYFAPRLAAASAQAAPFLEERERWIAACRPLIARDWLRFALVPPLALGPLSPALPAPPDLREIAFPSRIALAVAPIFVDLDRCPLSMRALPRACANNWYSRRAARCNRKVNQSVKPCRLLVNSARHSKAARLCTCRFAFRRFP